MLHAPKEISAIQAKQPAHAHTKHARYLTDNRPQTVVQQKQLLGMHPKWPGASVIQQKTGNNGLPQRLKTGVEALSGMAMNDVRVHYNSPKPAQLQAHAYAQGTDIHIAPGQEKHLPHEAWHVVQQKQGRVKPTLQLKGKVNINNDVGLEQEADTMGAKAWNITGVHPQELNKTSAPVHTPVQRLIIDEEDKQVPDETVQKAIKRYPDYIREIILELASDQESGFTLEQAIKIAYDEFGEEPPAEEFSEEEPGGSLKPMDLSGSESSGNESSVEESSSDEDSGADNFKGNSKELDKYQHFLAAQTAKKEISEEEEEELWAVMPSKYKNSREAIAHHEEEVDELRRKASLAEILAELNEINIEVQPSRGPELVVNLGDYFRNPRKYRNITLLSVKQEVQFQYALLKDDPVKNQDALTALHWALDELYIPPLKKGSGGGGGNLSVGYNNDRNELEVGGRPGFEEGAQKLGGMKSGFHRRHIVAWHSLKAAITNVINQLLKLQGKDAGIHTATEILLRVPGLIVPPKPEEQDDAPKIKRRGKKKKEKGPLPDAPGSDPKTLVLLLEHALSKINSNVLNLWPGDGYENSLINTYQSLFRTWAGEVPALSDEQVQQWKAAKVKDLKEKTAAKSAKYGRVVEQFIILLEAWAPGEPVKTGVQLSAFLNNLADNFEVDFPYSPDRRNFNPGQVVSQYIVEMAGNLLNWAEGNKKAFDNKTSLELANALENFLTEFLNPSVTPVATKTGDEETPVGTAKKEESSKTTTPAKKPLLLQLPPAYQRQLSQNFIAVPNVGNSCYIAGVMTTVLVNPQYRALFPANPAPVIAPNILGVMQTGQALLVAMAGGQGTPELVRNFRTALLRAGWLGGDVGVQGTQQDAGELLIFLLDLLGSQSAVGREHRWQDRGAGVQHTEHARSNVLNLTGIRAQGAGRTIEQLLGINLDRNRFDAEQLNNGTIREHNWRLEGALPPVLTIQLNRFNYSTILGRAFKLKERVTAGMNLTIPNALTGNGDVNYRLTSFIMHRGESTQGGHYTSYVRDGDNWFFINDDVRHQVTNEEVLAEVQQAYIITYQRV